MCRNSVKEKKFQDSPLSYINYSKQKKYIGSYVEWLDIVR